MTDDAILRQIRDKIFSGPDRVLYLHLGYFLAWFSACEIRITLLLARATAITDIEAYELLVKGMDARVKCERLRKACRRFKPIGPKLKTRLDFFETKIVKRRNLLSHCMTVLPEGSDTLHFASIGRMPYAAYGQEQITASPETLLTIRLFEYGVWLNRFSDDLQEVLQTLAASSEIEVKNPRSLEPKEFQ